MRTFNIRLTDEEFARIEAEAVRLGLSRAGLLRRLFERASVLEPKPNARARRRPREVAEPNLKGAKT